MLHLFKIIFLFFIPIFFLSQSVCAQFKIGYKQSGEASYYHDKFNGRKTSSGVKFSNNKYYAAHNKLPFNTKVKVTNKANGRSVVVEVVDRGPFKRGRIIDLSKRAALDIDMVNSGTAKIELEIVNMPVGKQPTEPEPPIASKPKPIPPVVNPGKPNTPPLPPNNSDKFGQTGTYSVWGTKVAPKGFGLQIGAFQDADNAVVRAKWLIDEGFSDVFIVSGWEKKKKLYRVIVGQYTSHKSAKNNVHLYKKLGLKPFVRKHLKS